MYIRKNRIESFYNISHTNSNSNSRNISRGEVILAVVRLCTVTGRWPGSGCVVAGKRILIPTVPAAAAVSYPLSGCPPNHLQGRVAAWPLDKHRRYVLFRSPLAGTML